METNENKIKKWKKEYVWKNMGKKNVKYAMKKVEKIKKEIKKLKML